MTRFDPTAVMAGLKQFQRATVDHVMDRFYGDDPTRRFLVADETGLGKSMVAAGVVAQTIEHLMRNDSVDRIDIVYVCSNADLARQNLKRIDVVHGSAGRLQLTDRLSMLALESHRLQAPMEGLAKPVNLISFTPGTSFDPGRRLGRVDERALVALLLKEQLNLSAWDMRAAWQVLRGSVDVERFPGEIDRNARKLADERDPDIVRQFKTLVRKHKLDVEFRGLIADIGRKQSLSVELKERSRVITGRLREELAKAGVDTLQPDLIILDEFQRFRHLLDTDGEQPSAAELAHQLFDYGQARVLLLSATPYKPYTLAEEGMSGEDHYRDLVRLLRFLCGGDEDRVSALRTDLAAYRTALLGGGDLVTPRNRLRQQLLRVMCRTERPRLGDDGMLVERALPADDVRPADLVDYVSLARVAKLVDAPLTVEYWKSAPYFANFMDGYRLGEKVKDALDDPAGAPAVQAALERTNRLDASAIESFGEIDAANAKLRRLWADTVDAGWWRLLWMPPSLPYLRPGGAWADESLRCMTKRLVFSSWTATPTAVAGLLSYEADRRIAQGSRHVSNTAEGRRRLASRLDFRVAEGRPAAMTALALFWPQPELARLADPLELARSQGAGEPIQTEVALAQVIEALRPIVTDGTGAASGAEAWTWTMAVRLGGPLPAGFGAPDAVAVLTGGDEDDAPSDPTGLSRHVDLAVAALAGADPEVDRPTDLLASVAALALHAPGNVAWRAVRRLRTDGDQITEQGLWRAAAVISSGLRALFNRHQASLLLDQLYGQAEPYWRVVLAACADGNLQAVLDEHLFLLRTAGRPLDDEGLLAIAQETRTALTAKLATYQASSPLDGEHPVSFPSRFALRYGAKQSGAADDGNVSRMAEVRTAFNSPFWPFVLATTSAGQEGIDFHLWCHAVFHWNTPASPVDFEQREGRVHRYGGHAVRRNVARDHGRAVLSAATEEHPWATAWGRATERSCRSDELAPYWIYPGPFKIERHVAPLPLSRDLPKLQSLKEDLALYRLAFGQPRQEDLVSLLSHRGTQVDDRSPRATIDLRPPRRDAV